VINSRRISVEDRGAGIPAGELARCFDRFYRASNHASAAGQQSAGLGLCVAKALTELQGGQIVLTSTLGHGTTASVRLPLRPD
jgi:signal transduction histidine kinase